MSTPRITRRYEAPNKKTGFTITELFEIMEREDRNDVVIRAITGFGGLKPGGPITALIFEEPPREIAED